MLGVFTERLTTLLNRTFLIAYWIPVLLAGTFAGAILVVLLGERKGYEWFKDLDAEDKALLTLGTLIGITLAAFVLQAFSTAILSLLRGRIILFQTWGRWAERRRMDGAVDMLPGPEETTQNRDRDREAIGRSHLYSRFPGAPSRLEATALGNVLRAAQDQPFNLYRCDPYIWLPRLQPFLPESARSNLDAASSLLIGLAHLAVLFAVVAGIGGLAVWILDDRWWLFLSVFLGGMVASAGLYNAAVAQARLYGEYLRSAFDLYRHKVITGLNLKPPKDLDEEQHLWLALNQRFLRSSPVAMAGEAYRKLPAHYKALTYQYPKAED